jgi:hypothetical protein
METAYPPGAGNNLVPKKSLKDRLPKLPLFIWLIILFFSALLISAGIYIAVSPDVSLKSIFSKLFGRREEVKNISTPYTTTPPPIGTGRQMYRISGGVQGLPTIEWIVFDPIDPAMGSNQTLTVKANDANPIKAVFVVLHTDNNTDATYALQQSSGTPTNGEWNTSFAVKNRYDLNYRATIKVQNQDNLFQMMTVTIR